MKGLELIAWILVIIGGINWGLIGIGGPGLNVIAMFFGMSIIARLIYLIVGISAIYLIYLKFSKKA